MIAGNSIKDESSRFATLLSENTCDRPPCDEILSEFDGCVVAPTLGSIVPNWLLVIPRTPVLNFALWHAETGLNPANVVDSVLRTHNQPESDVIWFEHGPAGGKSSIGCGVDHAHLHVLLGPPFTFEQFASEVKRDSVFKWEQKLPQEVYNESLTLSSYLVAGSRSEAIFAKNVESAGSQYFRRIVAELAAVPRSWNYRTHPYHENIIKTISALRPKTKKLEQL